MRPFLKWAGGKTFLLSELMKYVPPNFKNYFEPFVGGGALFFHLFSKGLLHNDVWLADVNASVIGCYIALSTDVEAVIKELKKHVNEEGYFYQVRALDPNTLTSAQAAARTIFLNKTCFNGLFRENMSGKFNSPFGRYKNPNICDEERLREAARALRVAFFAHRDFGITSKRAERGDLVYFDPPYVPMSKTSNFTSFDKRGFGEEDHRRLARMFKELADKGVHVILSNSCTPLVHELFEGEVIREVYVPRRVNSKGSERGFVKEVIVTPSPRKLKRVVKRVV